MSSQYSIEEMAFKHIYAHPNDKSGRWLAKMNRQYGRRAADKALKEALETVRAIDPTYNTKKLPSNRVPWQHPRGFW